MLHLYCWAFIQSISYIYWVFMILLIVVLYIFWIILIIQTSALTWVLHRCHSYSQNVSSEDLFCILQFGYKEDSTTLCMLIDKEVIDHYIINDRTVYSCCLDASKAFDRVHYGKLFSILLSKIIPKIVVRLYFDSYMRQKAWCVS